MDVWVPNLASAGIGALLGWAITHAYYRRANRNAERYLRMLTTLLLAGEEQGHYELARNENGEVTGGRVIRGQGHLVEVHDTVTGIGQVMSIEPKSS
jgi:hypothetical protein